MLRLGAVAQTSLSAKSISNSWTTIILFFVLIVAALIVNLNLMARQDKLMAIDLENASHVSKALFKHKRCVMESL